LAKQVSKEADSVAWIGCVVDWWCRGETAAMDLSKSDVMVMMMMLWQLTTKVLVQTTHCSWEKMDKGCQNK